MHNPVRVKLQDIIDGMDFQFDGMSTYLNLTNGEVISVSGDDIRIAEEDKPIDDLPDWQQDNIEAAIDVIENYENYKELPTKFDINEYSMMENFCYELKNHDQRDLLLDAINGRGAFRRFKDKVYQLGIEKDWFAFRDEQYKQVAIDWCDEHGITFE
ncbi:UPF0158 family protein [Paenibacillaceae bacterium WGS1546]|uniref:UPF0158 family protein n=1 Tax=Cohnella sp. WGS1546 TaxID=3366810 RepID=UPI00372D37C1